MTWGQNVYTRCAKDEWTAMPNLAALRAAIFLLSAKNRWGGTYVPPPPGRARVNTLLNVFVPGQKWPNCYRFSQILHNIYWTPTHIQSVTLNRINLGRLRLRLRGTIPDPTPAPNKMSRRLRLRLRIPANTQAPAAPAPAPHPSMQYYLMWCSLYCTSTDKM